MMVPFCRTPEEGRQVLHVMAEQGYPVASGLEVYVMAEIPSNALLADQFSQISTVSPSGQPFTAAHAGRGPRLDADRPTLRRTQRRRAPRLCRPDQSGAPVRAQSGHLWASAVGLPRICRLPGGAGHRLVAASTPDAVLRTTAQILEMEEHPVRVEVVEETW